MIDIKEDANEEFIEKLKQINKEIVKMLLLKIRESKNIRFIRFKKLEVVEVKI